jgi:hypothetical protein
VVQAATKWFRQLQSGSGSYKVVQAATKWFRQLQNGSGSYKVVQAATKWFRQLQNNSASKIMAQKVRKWLGQRHNRYPAVGTEPLFVAFYGIAYFTTTKRPRKVPFKLRPIVLIRNVRPSETYYISNRRLTVCPLIQNVTL